MRTVLPTLLTLIVSLSSALAHAEGELCRLLFAREELQASVAKALQSNQLVSRAQVYFKQSNLDHALRSADYAIKDNPKNMAAWDLRTQILIKMNLPKEALESFDRSFQVDHNKQTLIKKAQYLESLGRAESAISALSKLVQMDPQYTDAWVERAWVFYRSKQFKAALRDIEKALSIEYTISYLNMKVTFLEGADRIGGAIKVQQDIVAMDSKNPQVWVRLGSLLYRGQRYEEALSTAETAIQLDRHLARAWFVKAQTYWKLDQLTDAQAAAHEAAENQSDMSRSQTEDYQKFADFIDDLIGSSSKSSIATKASKSEIEDQLQLVEAHPTNTLILMTAVKMLVDAREYQQARPYIEEYTSLRPNDAKGWALQAEVLFELHEDRAALRATDKAMDLDPGDRDMWAQMAKIEDDISARKNTTPPN